VGIVADWQHFAEEGPQARLIVSMRDLQDKETGVSEMRLQRKRIRVQTF
jgi:hypothetical protein